MELSAKCYDLAEHLFETATEAELTIPHDYSDAPADVVEALGLNKVEWHLAHRAALAARRSGKRPASLLEQAARFFNSRTNEAGQEVFHMTCNVSGGGPR